MDITNTISNPDFIPTDTNLVLIGIAIMIILSFVFYKLYDESRYDSNGNRLSVKNTMKNMCGLYPLLRNTISKSTVAIQGKSKQLSDAVGEKSDELIKKLSLRRKEVFNIDNNAFTYNQAKKVCKAYGAKLATYGQVAVAHKNGANWCNYGWSANKMALYPIQKKYHEKIESNPKTKGNCGKPGVNGGRFKKLNFKFGVNCYGYRPEGIDGQLIYTDDPIYKKVAKEQKKKKSDLHKYKKLVRENIVEIRPFNDQKWSRYSYKNSRYILSPKDPLNLIIEETLDDEDKDPRNVNLTPVKVENHETKDNKENSEDNKDGNTSDPKEENK